MAFRALVLCIALVALSTSEPDESGRESQAPPVMVRRSGLTTIERVSSDGQVADTLFQTAGSDVFDLTISPSGRLVGTLERVDAGTQRHRLTVVDITGNVVRVVNRDVRAYVWCCDAERVAAVTGTYEEARGFAPTGAYLIDVADGTEQLLPIAAPVEVVWAAFDRALFFKVAAPLGSPNVLRYDPRRRESRLTDYRDLRFSPSGRFYLHHYADITLGPPGLHIFERESGREVARPDPSLGAIEGWVFSEGDYLQLKRARYPYKAGMRRGPEVIDGYTIYDVLRGAVAAEIQDSIRTDLIVQTGGLVLPENGTLRLIRTAAEIRR